MHERTRTTLAEVFNSAVAGRLASDAMSDALGQAWLPAMASLVGRDPGAAVQVRRLLVRLGWLLQHLPQAKSIHAGLLDRAIREYRADWQAIAPALFPDSAECARQSELLDSELLDSLRVSVETIEYQPRVARRPITPLLGTEQVVHPHDRGAPAAWQGVLAGSRARRRDEDAAMDALARIARLRAGDRVLMLLPGGRRETWRVVRREASREHLLMENEDTRRQGVLGLQTMANQLAEGRLAILG